MNAQRGGLPQCPQLDPWPPAARQSSRTSAKLPQVPSTEKSGSFGYTSARDAGWSSQVARRAHNPEVAGSNPAPATEKAPETGLSSSSDEIWLQNFCRTFARRTCTSARRGGPRRDWLRSWTRYAVAASVPTLARRRCATTTSASTPSARNATVPRSSRYASDRLTGPSGFPATRKSGAIGVPPPVIGRARIRTLEARVRVRVAPGAWATACPASRRSDDACPSISGAQPGAGRSTGGVSSVSGRLAAWASGRPFISLNRTRPVMVRMTCLRFCAGSLTISTSGPTLKLWTSSSTTKSQPKATGRR
jgi:hypothetical protein